VLMDKLKTQTTEGCVQPEGVIVYKNTDAKKAEH